MSEANGARAPAVETVRDVDERIRTASERVTLCHQILQDLKELDRVLATRSLRDVTSPPQKGPAARSKET